MSYSSSTRLAAALACLSILAVGACDQDGSFVAPEADPLFSRSAAAEPFDVYTQNYYLGGDTGPLFTLDFSNIPAIMQAASVFWQDVQDSQVPERAAAIADQIAERMPHVVGLQEVLQFEVLDGSFQKIGGIDLLEALEYELGVRNLPYVTEVFQVTTSSMLPLAVGESGLTWLAFTDRVVALRRTDVELLKEAHDVYDAMIPLAQGLDFKRGWVRLTVRHNGTPFHVVVTHLETQAAAPIQALQAAELLNDVVAGLDGVTLIVGDLNSDAASGPGSPTWTPTYDALRAGGFSDVWTLSPNSHNQDGLTCCQDSDLSNPVSDLDQRIDFVLVRTSGGPAALKRIPGAFWSDVVGDDPSERTASGLWAADHAGLTASMRLPRGLR